MATKDTGLSTACCPPLTRQPLTAVEATELARVFKALADPVRLRLLSLIASYLGGEACVCDLTRSFDVTGPTISHHLKVLKQAGLIGGERRGTWVYYWVVPAMLDRIGGVFAPTPAALAAPPAPATLPAPATPLAPAGREAAAASQR